MINESYIRCVNIFTKEFWKVKAIETELASSKKMLSDIELRIALEGDLDQQKFFAGIKHKLENPSKPVTVRLEITANEGNEKSILANVEELCANNNTIWQ